MAKDKKAKLYTVSWPSGTLRASAGLLEYLFGDNKPEWKQDNIITVVTGRRRYKYAKRRKSANAAGKLIYLDLGDKGVFSARLKGDMMDFVGQIAKRTGDKVKQVYTKRGSEYSPVMKDLPAVIL